MKSVRDLFSCFVSFYLLFPTIGLRKEAMAETREFGYKLQVLNDGEIVLN